MGTSRQSIVGAATRIFAEAGFERATVSEIARCAGVTPRELFREFQCKEHLLLAAFRNIQEAMFAALEEEFRIIPGETGLSMVLRLAEIYCRFLGQRRMWYEFLQRNDPDHLPGLPGLSDAARIEMGRLPTRMAKQFEVLLSLGRLDGSVREVPPMETALLVLGMIHGTVRLRLTHSQLRQKDLEPWLLTMVGRALAEQAA